MPGFRLCHNDDEIELPLGEFTIGRATDCRLVLDDRLASRRHAVLQVGHNRIVLMDLGSRNGVLVNGERITGPVEVRPGDRIVIGTQRLLLLDSERPARERMQTRPEGIVRRPRVQPEQLDRIDDDSGSDSSSTTRAPVYEVLVVIGDRELSLGRTQEAEMLAGRLRDVLVRAADSRRVIGPDAFESAVGYLLRVAERTSTARWLDAIFELYAAMRILVDAEKLDKLEALSRATGYDGGLGLVRYLDAARQRPGSGAPASLALIDRAGALMGTRTRSPNT